MLNGRYDAVSPTVLSQEPMFQLLGTDPARKRYRVSDSGHASTITPFRIDETLRWFDEYLRAQLLGDQPETGWTSRDRESETRINDQITNDECIGAWAFVTDSSFWFRVSDFPCGPLPAPLNLPPLCSR